jgi:hypothetical protein
MPKSKVCSVHVIHLPFTDLSFLSLSCQKGWTTDPEELDYDEYWARDDSPGQTMAKRFNYP